MHLNQRTPLKDRNILSVSELNQCTRELIEQRFPQVWVEGEISNLARPSSGHWYFTLKDKSAQVRCAMFTNRNRALRFDPQNGMQVILRGKASLYEGRGEFQLIAENLMPAGLGLLQQQFETLKQQLYEEGLFDPSLKKPLPDLPKHIAVITSPTGAALQDFLSVLERRFPAIQVSVIPAAVQGSQARGQLVAAINLAQQLPDTLLPVDILVLTRGGGSLEDLWPFNEEAVARAMHACNIPIICAVGHEVDFSIADFVADVRAPTPSAAAELASPDQQQWLDELVEYESWFSANTQQNITLQREQLNALSRRLKHPGQKIQDGFQRLDELESRLEHALRNRLSKGRSALEKLSAEFVGLSPISQIREMQLINQQMMQKLLTCTQTSLQQKEHAMAIAAGKLDTLSPLNTLNRGYSILMDKEGEIVRKASQTREGEQLSAQLAEGVITCRVEATSHDAKSLS